MSIRSITGAQQSGQRCNIRVNMCLPFQVMYHFRARRQLVRVLKQTRAQRTKKGMTVKLLHEKEQRLLFVEHSTSKTQIKSRAGTIHEHWQFFIQDVLVSGKKGGKRS